MLMRSESLKYRCNNKSIDDITDKKYKILIKYIGNMKSISFADEMKK